MDNHDDEHPTRTIDEDLDQRRDIDAGARPEIDTPRPHAGSTVKVPPRHAGRVSPMVASHPTMVAAPAAGSQTDLVERANELRKPLDSIRSGVERLMSEQCGRLEPEQVRVLGLIGDRASHLQRSIDDLLERLQATLGPNDLSPPPGSAD